MQKSETLRVKILSLGIILAMVLSGFVLVFDLGNEKASAQLDGQFDVAYGLQGYIFNAGGPFVAPGDEIVDNGVEIQLTVDGDDDGIFDNATEGYSTRNLGSGVREIEYFDGFGYYSMTFQIGDPGWHPATSVTHDLYYVVWINGSSNPGGPLGNGNNIDWYCTNTTGSSFAGAPDFLYTTGFADCIFVLDGNAKDIELTQAAASDPPDEIWGPAIDGDDTGPVVVGTSTASIVLNATFDDTDDGHFIYAGEWALSNGSAPAIVSGTGNAMSATDGGFNDETTDEFDATVDITAWGPGTYDLWVHSNDTTDGWLEPWVSFIQLQITDNEGPVPSAITAEPDPAEQGVDTTLYVNFTATDEYTNIAAAEWYFNNGSAPVIADGTGYAMAAQDAAFDSLSEVVTDNVAIDASWPTGNYDVWVHATDGTNWGTWTVYGAIGASWTYTSDATPPVISAGPLLDGVSPLIVDSPWEVTLTVQLDDSGTGGSDIDNAEYFIGAVGVPGAGTPMNPQDGAFDTATEWAEIVINVTGWGVGTYDFYVGGSDVIPNWMAAASYGLVQLTISDTQGPIVVAMDYPTSTGLGSTPTLNVTFRDAQSGIWDDASWPQIWIEKAVGGVWAAWDGPFDMTYAGAEVANGYFEYTIPSTYTDTADDDIWFYVEAYDGLGVAVNPINATWSQGGSGDGTPEVMDVTAVAQTDPYTINGWAMVYDGTVAGGYTPVPVNVNTPVIIEWVNATDGSLEQITTYTVDATGRYSEDIMNYTFDEGDGTSTDIWVNSTGLIATNAAPSLTNTFEYHNVTNITSGPNIVYINLTGGIPYMVNLTQPVAGSTVLSTSAFTVEYNIYDFYGILAQGYYGLLGLRTGDTLATMPVPAQLDGSTSATPGNVLTAATLVTSGTQWLNLTDFGSDFVFSSEDPAVFPPDGTQDPIHKNPSWDPGAGEEAPFIFPYVLNFWWDNKTVNVQAGGFSWDIYDGWNLLGVPMAVTEMWPTDEFDANYTAAKIVDASVVSPWASGTPEAITIANRTGPGADSVSNYDSYVYLTNNDEDAMDFILNHWQAVWVYCDDLGVATGTFLGSVSFQANNYTGMQWGGVYMDHPVAAGWNMLNLAHNASGVLDTTTYNSETTGVANTVYISDIDAGQNNEWGFEVQFGVAGPYNALIGNSNWIHWTEWPGAVQYYNSYTPGDFMNANDYVYNWNWQYSMTKGFWLYSLEPLTTDWQIDPCG